jgi:hypothetical protein
MRYGKDEQERMEPGKRKIKKESTPSHGEESGKKKTRFEALKWQEERSKTMLFVF